MHFSSALVRELDANVPFRAASPLVTRVSAAELREKVSQITSILQMTLDLDRLMSLFSEQVQSLVPHESIQYAHPTLGSDGVALGEKGIFLSDVSMSMGAEAMGVLTLGRGTPFTPAELITLRHVSTTLVYPLRNAMLYRLAREGATKDPLTGLYSARPKTPEN